MRQSWQEYLKQSRSGELTFEEQDRLFNGRWPDDVREVPWNDGSVSQSSPDTQSATTAE